MTFDLYCFQELFHLLEEEDVFGNPTGEVPVSNLAYELEAGGLKETHIQLVRNKRTKCKSEISRFVMLIDDNVIFRNKS